MSKANNVLSEEVTIFLDRLNHPFRYEIEELRQTILNAEVMLSEDIKWNGPNYSVNGQDCITMKIQPPKLIQIIFHRGAKVKEQPGAQLIADDSKLLTWRENDRAIATFKNREEVEVRKSDLTKVVKAWIAASCQC